MIPLFPELRPILEECFELAPEGAVYVVDERMRASAQGKAGWRNTNLRTTFTKIVRRAGLTPWSRLFHNLRASRQTELAEQFPLHVVCGWIGNSEDIAKRHYLQTTDAHFRQATISRSALQPALQQPSEMPRNPENEPERWPEGTIAADGRKTGMCNGLREPAAVCAAHVSPCATRTSGW